LHDEEKNFSSLCGKLFNPMAKYEMQESSLPNNEGKRILYPRLVVERQMDSRELARRMSAETTFGQSEVTGVFELLATNLASCLAQGYSVKLEGIGTFTASLSLRPEKERETGEVNDTRRNARSIEVGGINFRADKSLVTEINRQCRLERSVKKFKRSSHLYTSEERLRLAQQYLAAHPFLTVKIYSDITGLAHSTASVELRHWGSQADSGITTQGRGTHRVYIARKHTDDTE
jgi:predicted histone-like DNA-binding protein